MNVKNRRFIGLFAIMAVLLTFLLGTAVYLVNAQKAPVYKIETLQAEYQYGNSLTLADGYVEVGEDTYKLDTTVVYPDGRTMSYSPITLDCIGNYTVKYHTEQSGVTYEKEQSFTVRRTMANQFVNVQDCEINYNVDGPSNTGYWTGGEYKLVPYNGVSVKGTSATSQIRYNGIVDLSQLQRNQPFLKFLFTPEEMGSIEANSLTIRLTDIYDENNYVTMKFGDHAKYGPYEGSSLIQFCANDMYAPTGSVEADYEIWKCEEGCNTRTIWSSTNLKTEFVKDEDGNQKTDSNGNNLYKYTYTCPNCGYATVKEDTEENPIKPTNLYYYDYDENGDYSGGFKTHKPGTNVSLSFYGQAKETDLYLELPLYFDTVNQEVWSELVNPKIRTPFKQWKIFDFQNSALVGSNVWEGFATGEVYMDIFIEGSSKGANILITSANGVDLSGDSFVMDGKPAISIDYGEYTEDTMPEGLAGENYSYPIPKVFAYSSNCGMIKNVETIVSYIGEAGLEHVPVVNGRFATEKAGEYVVRYTATDENGNTTYKFFSVNVNETYTNALSYTFSDKIKETYNLGVDKIYLYDGISFGGQGKLSTINEVTLNGEKVEIKTDGEVPYFEPTVAGAYQFVCTVQDYIGSQKAFTKTITVADDGTPVFGEFYIPEAIRAGYAYKLPQATAKCGDTEATVAVTINGQAVTDGVYTPTQAGTVTVVYTATNPSNTSKITTVSKDIKVLATQQGKAFSSSYLIAEGMEYLSASKVGISYSVTNSEKGSLYFANSIVSSASVSFAFEANKANADRVRVTFIDARTGLEYAVDIVNTYGIPVAWHNGTRLAEMVGNFGAATANVMGLSYIGNGGIADSSGTVLGNITHSVDGRAFVEFGAEIYVKFEVIGGASDTVFQLRNINGQSFNDGGDWTAPSLYIEGDFATKIITEHNSTVTVPKAQAFDVFGAVTELSLTVLAPDGSLVYQGATDKDITFIADQIGNYSAEYYVADDATNGEIAMILNYVVLDLSAPTVGEVGLDKVVYKVGETLTVPTFDATDNFDSADTLVKYVVIVDYENMYRIVEGSYTFTKVGKYRIRFVAADTSMNMSYKEIVVYVVEGE